MYCLAFGPLEDEYVLFEHLVLLRMSMYCLAFGPLEDEYVLFSIWSS